MTLEGLDTMILRFQTVCQILVDCKSSFVHYSIIWLIMIDLEYAHVTHFCISLLVISAELYK